MNFPTPKYCELKNRMNETQMILLHGFLVNGGITLAVYQDQVNEFKTVDTSRVTITHIPGIVREPPQFIEEVDLDEGDEFEEGED